MEGALIPDLYFRYLRTGDFAPLAPVISHNATDILSLACLTAIVPAAFRDPARLSSGAEMIALARWFRKEGRLEESLALMRQALTRRVDEALVFETLWHVAELERKLERHDAALAAWSELSAIRNPWQSQAYERLAIHYEHREKNYAMALEMTCAALALEETEELRKREARLRNRVSKPKSGRLL